MPSASAARLSHVPPPPAPGECPVSGAYARLTEVFPRLSVSVGAPRDGDGWVTAAGLAAGGAELDAFLSWDDEQILRDYGERARPDVVASFGLHRYAWPVCLLFTIPWFLCRRVPRLPVDAVSYHRGLGRLTVRVAEFACLPGDPAAADARAVTVADEEALRGRVREAAAEHLGPVLDAFRPRMRRGSRALWGMATDELAEGIWRLGRLLGEEPRVTGELELLLPGTTPPYAGGAAFRALTGPAGESLRTRDRASCCLFYTLRPDDTCLTCPRTGDAVRVARMTTG
ncbi:(2Fe-2S)-binding protein [Streptomyces sp. UNOC14_S4]|uniref:(2Fe-2S)-binding protein n=1 Tax=Streptomyces sp. UNOC14_S4 TaxID=2872340 RepID=UPI001E3FB307|nr:(2Fe-2S)-binding protein [Streptomyces sp. UNOC14_S4]MCC3772604.1 (2Fe-2S)-binding protein [Streptomyces sp. UNOC14_S4]